MTPFDFDRIPARRDSDSNKWRKFPADVLPLWVADMDFASPPAVVAALHARVEHGFFGYLTEAPELRVSDSGRAVPADMAGELLRAPVRSAAGLGIGLYQAARHAEESGYVLKLSENRDGAVCFSLARSAPAARRSTTGSTPRCGSSPGRSTAPRAATGRSSLPMGGGWPSSPAASSGR